MWLQMLLLRRSEGQIRHGRRGSSAPHLGGVAGAVMALLCEAAGFSWAANRGHVARLAPRPRSSGESPVRHLAAACTVTRGGGPSHVGSTERRPGRIVKAGAADRAA
jgi:hypothetical protein